MANDKQTVSFTGGPLHGSIIEMPADMDPAALRITVTDSGTIFDRINQRPLRGAKLLRGPQPRKVVQAKAPAKKATRGRRKAA